MYFVYVLRNPSGRLYVGFTEELDRRLRQYQEGDGGWTRNRGPWELVYSDVYGDRAEALRREKSLKRGRQNRELRKRLGQ